VTAECLSTDNIKHLRTKTHDERHSGLLDNYNETTRCNRQPTIYRRAEQVWHGKGTSEMETDGNKATNIRKNMWVRRVGQGGEHLGRRKRGCRDGKMMRDGRGKKGVEISARVLGRWFTELHVE
jgi:hypothetical protein